MNVDPIAEIFRSYLHNAINDPVKAVLDIDKLPDGFRALGEDLKFIIECIIDTRKLAKDLSRGILNNELPSRKNEIAAPLKSLQASLKHLTWQTKQIAHGDYNQRVNHMGEFTDSFNKMVEQLAQRDSLLHTVNHVANCLLSRNEETLSNKKSFESSLKESMAFLGSRINIDRVHIWRSGTINENHVLFHNYEWDSEDTKDKPRIPLYMHIPFDTIQSGEVIQGPIAAMPVKIQDLFKIYKILSIGIIPLFYHDKCWGALTLDNYKTERFFSEEEIHILQSAGLMMSSAILRNEEQEKIEKQAHWYHSILDAIPLPISVTDTEMNWTFINAAVENILKLKRKDIIGKSCSSWGAHICGCDECGIACVKRGIKQTFFHQNNSAYKVDVEILKDLNEQCAGFIEIVQDITEIETLAKRQAEAEAANNAKSLFLANMSHEMRTPMNVILGLTEIQMQDDSNSENITKAFHQIYESGHLLLNIINDILDLSKIEAGKIELLPENYDIPSLVNDISQLKILRYDSNHVEFSLNVEENTPLKLFGDKLRIRQILNNILSNAFKYTKEGSIKFSISSELLDKENVTIIFQVSDTGQGMTKEQVGLLFDEYTRFNADANREIAGTGLGMSITKHLVNLMNGKITVESEPGKGSIFTVYIPQKQIDTDICGKELAEKLKNIHFQNTAAKTKSLFTREYMPYGSVLIVDDVKSNIYIANGLMSIYGLKIDCASSGFQAIEKIKNGESYDIIFMDHMMPKMDGIETVKIIRAMDYKHAIVALTANVLIGREKMFLDNGFNAFLSKPIDSRELNKILNEYIRNKKPPEIIKAAQLEQQKNENNKIELIKQTAAHKKIYKSELKKFIREDIKNSIAVLENINKNFSSISDENIKLFIITVHGMKSALANIGETELSELALNLEKAGEQKEMAVIKNDTPVFLKALYLLLEKNEEIQKENDTVQLLKDDENYLRLKLLEIKAACEKSNKNAAKNALNDLKLKKWPENINNILDDLSLHLLHSAFKKALYTANTFIKLNIQITY